MAEALLRHLAGDRFDAYSAGLEPTAVHALTRQVLAEVGLNSSALQAKDIKGLLGRVAITYAIVVCEQAEQMCPRLYPFALQVVHWPFDDPALPAAPEVQLAAFRRVRDEISARMRAWLAEVVS